MFHWSKGSIQKLLYAFLRKRLLVVGAVLSVAGQECSSMLQSLS